MPENQVNVVNEIDTPQEVEVEKEKMAGSRKLVVSGIVLAIGVAIALYKGDIPEHLLQLLEVVFGGFIVGNVAGHAMGAAVEHAEIKYAPPSPTYQVSVADTGPTSTPSVDLSKVEATLAQQTQEIMLIQQTLLMIIKKAGLDK